MQQQFIEPQFNVEGGHLVMFHQDQTGLPQVKDANVNDRDRMQDLLSQEKYLTNSYNVAMYEAGSDPVYRMIKQNSEACHEIQRQIFNLMFQKGWYKLPVADAESVAHTYNQWKKYQAQLPFPPGQQRSTMAAAQPRPAEVPQPAQATQPVQPTTVADQAVQQAVRHVLDDVAQGRVAPGAVTNRSH